MLAWAWASADCTRTAINVLFMCRGIRFDFRMVQGWPQGSCGSMPGSLEACTSAPSPIGMTRPLPPSIPPSRADCLQIPCHFLLCLGCLAYIPLLFMRLPQYLQVFYHIIKVTGTMFALKNCCLQAAHACLDEENIRVFWRKVTKSQ